MPSRPKQHKPAAPQTRRHEVAQDRQARRALNTGSKAWRLIREQILIRDCYTCQICRRIAGAKGEAHVDHKNGDDSNSDPSNLWTLCRTCHSTKTAAEDGGFGNARARRSK